MVYGAAYRQAASERSRYKKITKLELLQMEWGFRKMFVRGHDPDFFLSFFLEK